MLPAKRLKLNQNAEKKAQTRNAEILTSIKNFTTDLFKCIVDNEKGEKENLVCSGLSIHLVLSMCALGAEDNTAKEMLDGLHLTKDKLSIDFKNIITHLEDVGDIELIVSNRIFADESIQLNDNFKNEVSDFFLSDVVTVNFASQLKVVKDINDWCAEKTNNKIKEILSDDDVDSTTKMILTNAVYFKACWYNPFLTEHTSEKPFYIDKDTSINVATMHRRDRFLYKYLKRFKAECISIPYRNQDYSLVIIKPLDIDGLEQLEIKLQKIKLDYNDRLGKKSDFEYDNIDLALPKFKIESKIDLKEYLSKMGMVEMFTPEANFKGICENPILDPPIYVDKVFQKAFIEVNEVGTEATAFTYVKLIGGGYGGPPTKYRDFKVDRPFLYRIVNKKCNLTLFSGRVVKPTY